MRWPDITAPLPIVLLPVGSTEQHGPHLPADTDSRVAVAVAEAVARRLPDVVVAPALAYGASGEHAGFPATASIGTEVLRLVLVELVRSLDATASGVVIVNGHGGNAVPVASAATLLLSEGRRVLTWAPRAVATCDPHAVPDLHAGRMETSLLLHLAPHLVRLENAVAGPEAPGLADLVRDGVRQHSPTGVLGDPAGASADEGEKILLGLAGSLEAALEVWRGQAWRRGAEVP